MESPLSFNSSENFRKKLLVRNLPPYKVDNAFSNDSKPGTSEYVNNDLTPIDSPSVEQIGNKQEQLLFPINQYGPQNNSKEYGNTVSINDNLNYKTNEGEYGYPDSIGSDLEIIGNETEKQIIIKNVYRPENGVSDFGSTAWYINNDKVISTIGEGEYTVQDTVGSSLEVTGQIDRPTLITNNQYGPQNLPTTEVSINNNLQTNPNEGEYGFPDTLNSPLENEGDSDRPVLFAINQYGPENLPTNEVQINQNLQTNSNEGEYGFPDTVGSELQIVGAEVRKPNFLQNQWGPEQGQSETEIEPYRKLKSLTIPQGNYDVTDSNGSVLEIVGGVKETEAYLSNRYATGDGEYDPTDFRTFQQEALQLPYANSDNTFIFLPSTYTPYSILLNENPSGSDGSLSEDSSLAIIGAKTLNKEFKHRVAYELYQQTLGQVNIFNSNINPDTGEISVKPNTDPFDAVGLLTGNIPVVSRVYNITTPDFLFGQGINFAAKLAGLYSPYSYIPGDYFDYPNRIGNGNFDNPLSLIGGAIGSLFSVLQPSNQSSSELLVEYTSIPTRKLLYDQLRYNIYRPDYKIGNNLTAPPGSFYIGSRKSQITDIVSPSDQLPLSRDGKTSSMGPVLSYGRIGKEYEGELVTDAKFGLNTRNYYSTGSLLTGPKIFGGFTWTSLAGQTGDNYTSPGTLQGIGGEDIKSGQPPVGYGESRSVQYDFTPGSILDVTQKLVDAGNRSTDSSKLEHVGNAINQVSKVFNDGYQEITKGSRVIRYTTKNSTDGSSSIPQGFEYCRVFTKDRPYYTYNELQKSDGNIRGYTNSVLDDTYNLNIVPTSNNIQTINGTESVKKYMFSLENLAWRTSNRKGYTYDDLPSCEKGPNGGRIMWFPPYDLSFDESISTSWQDNNFLGRTEPIYTYTNTSRKGNVSFKIIVDHPSIMNLLVNEELKDVGNNNQITNVIDSFFAGCTKYDLWDLVSKFPNFTPNDIFEAQVLTTQGVVTVVGENNYTNVQQTVEINTQIIPPPEPSPCIVYDYEVGLATNLTYTGCTGSLEVEALNPGDTGTICVQRNSTPTFSNPDPTNKVTPTGQDCKPATIPAQISTNTTKPNNVSFPDIGFYFDNNFPNGTNTRDTTTSEDFEYWYNLYMQSENCYINGGCSNKNYNGAIDKIIAYSSTTRNVDLTDDIMKLSANEQNVMLGKYIDARKSSVAQFFRFIESEFAEAQKFVKIIGEQMQSGKVIEFSIIASASATSNPAYNLDLSKRRADSVTKWIYKQKSADGTTFQKYKEQGKLKITVNAQGDTAEIAEKKYNSIKCNNEFNVPNNTKYEGTVSVNAMACRRTRIEFKNQNQNNSQTQNPTPEPSNTQVNQEQAGQDFVIVGQSQQLTPSTTPNQPNNSTNPFVAQSPTTTPNTVTPPNVREQEVQTQQRQTYKDLTKKLARKLLTECNYFEFMEREAPMVYDGIKSKIKYFQPAFHSITPEGLNSRLVFLQQCMRPGDTIPTISTTDNGQQELLYNDVSNSAFGAPPICVLRIGDFFNTKIAIDQISLKYEDGRFDLNPEGIGVQPMIADVSISFSFIGAHGLAGPVAKLQNALSFNYYANTETYDERAEITEQLEKMAEYDRQAIDQIESELGVVNTEAPRPEVNNGGVTIGTTLTNVLDFNTSATTGTIKYQEIMAQLSDSTKEYADKITSTLEKINEEMLIGGLQIFTKDRRFIEGNFNYLGGNLSDTAKIFGYSNIFQQKVEDLANLAKEDVDNNICPILIDTDNENLVDVQIRKFKKQIKSDIDKRKDEMIQSLKVFSNEITSTELPYINLIDRINYVSNGNDGFVKKNNSTIIYNLSGTTDVTPPTLAGVSNTLQELVQDSLLIRNELNIFYQKLIDFKLIPTVDFDYTPNYTQDMYFSSPQTPNVVRFFMLFGKQILDDPNKFKDELIQKAIPNANSEDTQKWNEFLDIRINQPQSGLYAIYSPSKSQMQKNIEDFKSTYYNPTFNTYNPYNKSKPRIMWYQSQVVSQEPENQNLKNLYSNKNDGGNKFNLQKSFK